MFRTAGYINTCMVVLPAEVDMGPGCYDGTTGSLCLIEFDSKQIYPNHHGLRYCIFIIFALFTQTIPCENAGRYTFTTVSYMDSIQEPQKHPSMESIQLIIAAPSGCTHFYPNITGDTTTLTRLKDGSCTPANGS
jgi:hypothetical protein